MNCVFVHVSSTFESGALRIHCLAKFASSPFSTFIRSPMNLLPSVVHVTSTFESGVPRIYCLALVRQFSILHFYSEPHEFIA